jgi:Ca2+-dependent lipid-binding protein
VHVESARGLKATKVGGGAPDPYVTMGIGLKPAINKTKTIDSTANPTWNESQYILINSLMDTLHLSIFDYNEHRADNLLGTISHELAGLAADAEQEGLTGKVFSDGKDRGELHYNLSFYPVLLPQKLADGTVEPPADSTTGIVRLTIHQAKDLDLSKVTGTLSPYAKVYLGSGQHIHRTPTIKSSNTPIWESSTEFLVPNKNQSTVTIRLQDDREFARNPALGTATIRLTDLLEAKNRQQDWFPLSKARSGKIRISTEWKPLGIAGGISGAASYVAPIGIMRIWIKKATDVKNVESALGGKSDPYVRVMLNNQTLAKTEVVNNNLNPEWDQIVYVPVHRLGERLLLEVMDYQNITSDRSLGTVELKVSDFVRPNTTNPSMPFMSSGGHDVNQPIRQARGQGTKGTLSYHASFCPGTALRGGVHFEPTTDGLAAIPEALTSKGSRRSSYASIKSHASFQRVHKGAPSADSTLFFSPPPLANGGSADTDGRSVFEDEDDNRSVIENESGLDMTRTELLAQRKQYAHTYVLTLANQSWRVGLE